MTSIPSKPFDHSVTEHYHDEASELTAAAALTSLTRVSFSSEKQIPTEITEVSVDRLGTEIGEREEVIVIPERYTKSGRKRAVPFPMKLMKVLSNKDYADIIAWMPSGKAFQILKPKQFTNLVLPAEFKSAKFSSFTRKLHRWGFMRHYRGEDAGAFFHKDFQKGRMDLLEEMTRYKDADDGESAPAPKRQKINKKAYPATETESKVAASSPARQCPRVTPLSTAPPRSLPHQTTVTMPSVGSSTVASLDKARLNLNAAIEAEVSRRLNERFGSPNARQLLTMQLEQQRLRAQLALQQHRQYQQLQQRQLLSAPFGRQSQVLPMVPNMTQIMGRPLSTMNPSSKKLNGVPLTGYTPAYSNMHPFENIQGAKTA